MIILIILEFLTLIVSLVSCLKGNKTMQFLRNKKRLLGSLFLIIEMFLAIFIKKKIGSFYLGILFSTLNLILLNMVIFRFNMKEAIYSGIFTMALLFNIELITVVVMLSLEGEFTNVPLYLGMARFIHILFLIPILRMDTRGLQALIKLKWADFTSSVKIKLTTAGLLLVAALVMGIVNFNHTMEAYSFSIFLVLYVIGFVFFITAFFLAFVKSKRISHEASEDIIRRLEVLKGFYQLSYYIDDRLHEHLDLAQTNKVIEFIEKWLEQGKELSLKLFSYQSTYQFIVTANQLTDNDLELLDHLYSNEKTIRYTIDYEELTRQHILHIICTD